MGRQRSLDEYLRMVGIDPAHKEVRKNLWCHQGQWPEEALRYRLASPAASTADRS
jgi:ribulose bisphosphate carboxylase small subunit